MRGEGAFLVDDAGVPVHAGPARARRPRPARRGGQGDHAADAGDRAPSTSGSTPARFGAAKWERRFPTILATCRAHGVDPVTELIPVAPACHYASGGVATDLHGQSSVPGLFACGEVACSGVHGANRLASNSLLEGLVFSRRIADRARRRAARAPRAGRRPPARRAGARRRARRAAAT